MRLIDADALKDKIHNQYNSDSALPVHKFYGIIDFTPTYDPPVSHYSRPKSRKELLAADYDELTEEEKERWTRAKAIPAEVVKICNAEYLRLRNELMQREQRMNILHDFIDGYDMSKSCGECRDDIPF